MIYWNITQKYLGPLNKTFKRKQRASTYPINAITAAINLVTSSALSPGYAGGEEVTCRWEEVPLGAPLHGFPRLPVNRGSALRFHEPALELFHRATQITRQAHRWIRCQPQVPLGRWSQIQSLLEPLGRLTLNTSAVQVLAGAPQAIILVL